MVNRSLLFQSSVRVLRPKLSNTFNPPKQPHGLPKNSSSQGTSALAFLTITSPYITASFAFYNMGSISSVSTSDHIWLCLQY